MAQYWPLIEQCLQALNLGSDRCCIAALATVRVECPPFKPIKEYGGDDYLNKMYDTRTNLGNSPEKDGDGARFAGRGFIQITGKLNYAHYGKLLGVDLTKSPDAALEPNAAAAILAAYFHEHAVDVPAEKRDWKRVRKLVNGGYNGLADFLEFVARLETDVTAARGKSTPE